MADEAAVAERFGVGRERAGELLLDFQAFGWISWSEFAGSGGWSMTAAGRAENERQLAVELQGVVDGEETVRAAYEVFLPLNGRLQQACTDWQLRPTPVDSLAFNDHSDPAWDKVVIGELQALDQQLESVVGRLTGVLDRFQGYDRRFSRALGRAVAGEVAWVDGTGVDSCHTVWFELHEDLLATLGLQRGD
ncbi:transcriptional regulator [Kribbella monticola]|uniref:transcriptional regulator n=1 Tax=Kribbella monticola TaxID=2185285 RepID=UPI001E2FBCC5|nr:transcriptional regulator [Kribbella monticola]